MSSTSVVSSAFTGMRYLIFLQVASRIITYLLNNQMIVAIDLELFGIFSIQYQLIMSTILQLTREGFRVACQRSNIGAGNKLNPKELAQMMNLAWISVPLGIPVTIGTVYCFKRMTSAEELAIPNYEAGIYLFAIGSILELVSEPMYILAQNLFLFKVRTVVEASSIFLRCIITYYLVVTCGLGLLGFGYAQIFYGIFLIVGYFGYFFSDVVSSRSFVTSFSQLFPSLKGGINRESLTLWKIYEWQSVQKFILTEGEKFVLWLSASLVDQGIYSVVNNLGSLVARFLFQPVEEMCRLLFSKLFANSKEKEKKDVAAAQDVLRVLLKLMVLIGLIFVAFGPNFSALLLDTLYSRKFSGTKASAVLAWYCVYVAVIAVNGITEAFVHAVASPEELRWFNVLLISFSVVYVTTASVFIRLLETSGLIFANCINMGLRVAFSTNYILKFFKEFNPQKSISVTDILPNKVVLVVLGVSFFATWISSTLHPLVHFAAGAFFGLSTIAAVYLTDRPFIGELKNMIIQRRANKSE
eukprot:Phypoly_transcript_07335.p1 GENE.Phypoly_transcript_07335~~Phypoly_transcript_07335.p1  ORF type:complete len:527 (+),score=56.41 Phypoly_transcript_07335:39-1619(+)